VRREERAKVYNTAIIGVLVVSLSVLLALAGLVLVHRLVPTSLDESHNAVAGIIYMPLSGLFGVLTAFTVFLVWQQFEVAAETTQREASALADIYWHGDDFSESDRHQVQELAHSYAQVVIEEEWPLMHEGQESPRAWAIVDELRTRIDNIEPGTASEQALYGQEVARFDEMVNDRRLRLLQSREGVPPILWTILLIGAPIVVAFTYFFEVKNFRAHLLMVAMLTIVVAITLFAVKALEYPYSGDTRVKPTSIENVLAGFEANTQN
jgi:uncharacterized membrane-anchored protein